jgi:hypothetical protein
MATGQVERWINAGATIVAPATALSTLLFYFGYVSSRSEYEFFGIDVDTIGLGTQDYIMRSPQPLLVPLLVFALLGVGVLALHSAVRVRTTAAVDGTSTAWTVHRFRRTARVGKAAGGVLLTSGVVLLLMYAYLGAWTLYPLVTPVLLVAGAALVAYASWLAGQLRTPAAGHSPMAGRMRNVLLVVLIAAGVLWSTATLAQWSGRGLAQDQAGRLADLPIVILDTKESLVLHDPGIEETILPASAGQTFHYRYRHLRLLIQGHDRMFLVPDHWSPSDSTLVVSLDSSVRVRFQFQNYQR